jgi:hypothetical protein
VVVVESCVDDPGHHAHAALAPKRAESGIEARNARAMSAPSDQAQEMNARGGGSKGVRRLAISGARVRGIRTGRDSGSRARAAQSCLPIAILGAAARLFIAAIAAGTAEDIFEEGR